MDALFIRSDVAPEERDDLGWVGKDRIQLGLDVIRQQEVGDKSVVGALAALIQAFCGALAPPTGHGNRTHAARIGHGGGQFGAGNAADGGLKDRHLHSQFFT